ncbi:group II intron reverse transcriptase/maturase [Stigmatella hybrida]|uniref:group II intron reverse transcriptase/maturase n=1 Tax=Stigmatella hybrida TaxID=394097 RepID=UPI0037DA59CD
MSPAGDGTAGRTGKACSHEPVMNDAGKSDEPIVPVKRSNNAARAVAEAVEGRGKAKGNAAKRNADRTQSRSSPAHSELDRVRSRARKDKEARFTALLHHVTVERLGTAFMQLKRNAAPGVDGVTWEQYGERLEENLLELHARLHRGAYRAKPSRRTYIPKADGRQRPLGIASLEDKLVQRAVVEVMNAIYEKDFLGFSYGFRPGRSQHDALDALAVGLKRRKVNWVLDADIRGFFDAIDHGWLVKFVEHRIGDHRLLRLIQKWLNAGVMEEGTWTQSKVGSPQGATVSPLLANIYLHYALDLWVHQWRKRTARGEVVVVRYADDFVVGFEHEEDGKKLHEDLRERLRKFQLELHSDKTRLIEFGRDANAKRLRRGERGAAETFRFLGLVHICGKSRRGYFLLTRHTDSKRMRTTLRALKNAMARRRHEPVDAQGRWLGSVVRGYFAYHAVPTNSRAIGRFRTEVIRTWEKSLRRRSQRHRLNWKRMTRLADRWLPPARIQHPWPDERFYAKTRGGSPVR